MTRMRDVIRFLLAATVLLAAPSAAAQAIGEPIEAFEERLPAAAADAEGWVPLGDDLRARPRAREDLLWRLDVAGTLEGEAVEEAARLLAAATGYGEGLEEPIAGFLRDQAPELAGRGAVEVAVQEYRLELDIESADPLRGRMTLFLPNLPEDAFPAPAAVRGPEDAAHAIRVFSDFQCPFCGRYAEEVLPGLEQLLQDRDVRYEYHHFPLESLHPNAAPAAEAAECVAEEGGEEAFWAYHDLLFARRAAWADLDDPLPYLARLAREADVARAEVATCLEEGRHAAAVAEAAQAAAELGLTGTPTVFVDGFRMSDYRDPDAYRRYLELSEAFAPPAGAGSD